MKRSVAYGFLLLLISLPAFAAKNSQTVTLPGVVQVGSTQLPAGDCKVTWTGTGADGQVTLTPTGSKPVTLPVQVVTESHSSPAVLTMNVKGVSYLEQLQLSKVKLIFKDIPQSGN